MKFIMLLLMPLGLLGQDTAQYTISLNLPKISGKYTPKYRLHDHLPSLSFTAINGAADGLRDAALFGRTKHLGPWWDLSSWQRKYKNGDPAQGPAFFGSTTIFVAITDAPHAANMVSNITGELAKVYSPDMTKTTFIYKLKVALINTVVRSAFHNIVYGIIFKPK